jgi:DNA-binding CsgD family transcriptional regulator/GAF domain-containing protein
VRELRAKDYKELLHLLDIVYSASDRVTMFQAVWERLDRWIGIGSAVWLPMEAENKQFVFKDLLPYHSPLSAGLLFTVYYAPLDPLVSSEIVLEPMRACKITDAISPARLPHTEYGHDFQRLTPLFYEMAATVQWQGDLLGCIGLHRPRRDRDFTERHRTIVNLFLPHLTHALHAFFLRDALAHANDYGVISQRADGTVEFMNGEAARALNGRPVSAILTVTGPDSTILHSASGSYRVRSMPIRLGSRERIVILDPLPHKTTLTTTLERYGISKRETEIIHSVMRGFSNAEVADQLCIAEQTVKDHLRHVYDKMKIHRRSELAALLLKGSPRRS